VNVGSVEALLQYSPEPGVTILTSTWEPLLLWHTPQTPNLRPEQVPQIAEVHAESLCPWTSGNMWVMCLLLSLDQLLNCSSPLSRSQLWLCVSSTCPRTGPALPADPVLNDVTVAAAETAANPASEYSHQSGCPSVTPFALYSGKKLPLLCQLRKVECAFLMIR
jgi:hypothetical protein